MTYNLSLMTPEQQRAEELKLKASLLVHNLKAGKIKRFDVEQEIYQLDESEQGQFKEYLNSYRKVA